MAVISIDINIPDDQLNYVLLAFSASHSIPVDDDSSSPGYGQAQYSLKEWLVKATEQFVLGHVKLGDKYLKAKANVVLDVSGISIDEKG